MSVRVVAEMFELAFEIFLIVLSLSSCQLTVGENQGTIVPYSGLDIEDYTHLIHTPTRPSNDFYTLEDIIANGMSLQGEHINILAVVKRVKNSCYE